LDFYSASSLKQQSAGRHVTQLGHIILVLNQPVIVLSPCVISGEAADTNFIVFFMTTSALDSTIYRTRAEHANHYTTDTVPCFNDTLLLMSSDQFSYSIYK
jgi:hypothetical protein